MEEKFRNKDNAGSFKRDFQFAVVEPELQLSLLSVTADADNLMN